MRQAFAEARAAGVKEPLLCGAIPFDTRQPSALFVPHESRWFDRAAFMAGVSPAASGPEIAGLAEVPTQQPFMQMVSDAVAAMKAGQLDKVVLSRLLEIETRRPVDRHALMARVIAQNPNGFHFHVPLERGALLGASLSCCCARPAATSTPTRWPVPPGARPMPNAIWRWASG